MNSRERLTRCYFNQETDRPGVYTRTCYPWNDPTYVELRRFMEANSDLKIDWICEEYDIPGSIEQFSEPYSEDYKRETTVLHTPAGDLISTIFKSLKGMSNIHETYFIKTREDAEKYLSLPMPEVGGDVSAYFNLWEKIGDKGIIEIALLDNPAGFTATLTGSENFATMSITDRDIIHALCERHMNVIMKKIKFLFENKMGPFFDMQGEEYIVPPVHGPADFYDFNVKYDKPIIDLVHEGGGRMHIHCHGPIKKVIQGFIDMRADVLHPFETPPPGDITAAEAKSMIRDKICMEGNIQISRMYENAPEAIREETLKLINDAYDDHKGLIVSPTASPYISGKGHECFEQYKAMVDAVLSWRG